MLDRSLKDLDIEKLWAIVACEDSNELDAEFKHYLTDIDDIFASKALEDCDDALESALEDSTQPMDLYVYLTSLVGLGFAQFALTIGVFTYTCLNFMQNYDEKQRNIEKKKQKDMQFFQLAQLRIEAADALSERLLAHPILSKLELLPHHKSAVLDEKPQPVPLSTSAWAGLKTSILIFGGYYLSAVWIIETVSAFALAGPIGLAVAAGVAVAFGLYCFYRNYTVAQNINLIQHEKNKLQDTLVAKKDSCRELMMAQHNLRFFKPAEDKAMLTPVQQRELSLSSVGSVSAAL